CGSPAKPPGARAAAGAGCCPGRRPSAGLLRFRAVARAGSRLVRGSGGSRTPVSRKEPERDAGRGGEAGRGGDAAGRGGDRRFHRSVGLLPATAINMTQMVGIGPFITIPLMVATFAGPQAIVGWIAGAVLAICDGLVWAELGAAMPDAGGTYVYLREAFQYRTGKLMPFLFIWTIILTIPLIIDRKSTRLNSSH